MASPIHTKFIKNGQVKNVEGYVGSNLHDMVIYEVVRLIDGKILFLEDHIERFFNSLNYVGLKNNLTREGIIAQLGLLVQANQSMYGNIRFEMAGNITKGHEFMVYFIAHAYPTDEQYKNGVTVAITEALRDNPNAKVQHPDLTGTINQIISKENVYEVIMVHPNGYVTEGSRSNLFMIKGQKVITAPMEDILPGITRKYIIQVCNDLKLEFHEGRISRDGLFAMDALFISGTSPKVLPISNIADKQFDISNPTLRSIMKEFDMLLKRNLANNPKII